MARKFILRARDLKLMGQFHKRTHMSKSHKKCGTEQIFGKGKKVSKTVIIH
jgi:hypothetical protein